jgi:hemerythrin superfamily protein
VGRERTRCGAVRAGISVMASAARRLLCGGHSRAVLGRDSHLKGQALMPNQEATPSVFDLLKADHRKVEKLFAAFEDAEDEQKVELAREICTELSVHAEAEEKAFYPAAREALGDEGDDLVREAIVEHRSLKELIAAIDGSSPKQDLFEANVKVLKEYVEHHVKEEEKELFPMLEKADFDAQVAGAKVAATKTRLMKKVTEQPSRGRGNVVHVPSLTASAGTKSKSPARKKTSSRPTA